MNAPDQTTTRYLITRLYREYISLYKPTIALAVICMIIAAAMTSANAYLLQPALDEIFVNKNKQMLVLIPLALIAVGIVGALANYGQTVLMRKVGQGIIAKMQIKLFEHLLHSDVALFADQSSGKLISRFTNDIQLMRNAVSSVLTGFAKDALSMVFLIALMFYQSWQLSLIAFLLFPIAILPIIRLGKRMRKISDGTQAQLSQFAGQLDESFSAVRVIKAYTQEEHEVKRAEGIVNHLYTLYMKASRIQAMASPMIEMMTAIAIAAIIAFAGMQAMKGEMTQGAFASFVVAMVIAYKPIRSLAGLNTQFQEGLAAARRFFAVMDTEPEVKESANATSLTISKGDIQLTNVSYDYHPKAPALSDVTMTIPAGKMVALVGASGSGKSTLMQLLMRFYDVSDGAITIDGQDIRDVTFASLRQHMAYVSQEVMLFDDTISANIAYGKPGATQSEIEEVAKHAAAHEFIEKLPHGYDTRVGPHGIKLSGGQRQRLSIARAMLKNAPILLLDEATSSLDTTSEKLVQKALDDLMQHRTTLVIAHRLSTIRHADIIYVLDAGKIVESGSHDTLLEAKGAYYWLYETQFRDAS